jgi:antitoxin PrlF
MASTVTSKGQITIPAEVRKALGLRSGSRVAFVRTASGSYELVPEISSIKALKGAVAGPKKPVTTEEMDAAVAAAAARSMSR